jgi:gliding motility-associated-like protein
MAYRFFILPLCFLLSSSLSAQAPVNDDCPGIIDLGDIPICPVPGTFTNVDATGSVVFTDINMNQPSCWNGSQPETDVWFSFNVPVASPILDITVEVNGVAGPNGAILQPQVAIYRGECLLDEMEELACATSAVGETTVEVDLIGLDPGFTYFIRIEDWSATAANNWGDFEICLKEPEQIFNMGEEPGSGACEGTLFDSGGPDGNYQNNEFNTFVICPNTTTNCINIDVVSTQIETNFDNLTFFEGDDINGSQLWNFTGTGGAVSLQLGGDCITVLFDSDFSVVQAGFELNWSCSSTPCATTLFPCEETQAIFGLPFFDSNQTTCGDGDDVQDGPCGDGTTVLQGEDMVYTYFSPGNECIQLHASGVNLNTGLSVYNGCPESATECLAFAQNIEGDSVVIQSLELESPGQIFIVLSNADCTDFDLEIQQVECPVIAPAQASCGNAILLNTCDLPQELFYVSQISSTNPDYFQTGINDGCLPGLGAAHLTWLMFQAQADGDFGFLVEPSDPFEDVNLDIQVWGPISDPDMLCDFIANNQPARSTGANPNSENLTGLIDISPINGALISDQCESSGGDGFVTTLSVTNASFYLILLNDFSGNMINGWADFDFSPTSPGVLDGLPPDSPLTTDPYTTIGTAFYNPQGADYSCIQLTSNQNTQLGCAWQQELVDFSQPFTNAVTMNFGTNDGGADGMCMVYHLDPAGDAACGTNGGEIGAGGITNSLIIEFDTWQNADNMDPFQDHIAVNINGEMGAPLTPPAILPNIENGQDYQVEFSWDPTTMTYEVYFDGVLQITGMFDVIANCFNGESLVYCGYTGSTGGASNLQTVCTGQNVFPAASLDTVLVELCDGESYVAGGTAQTTPGFYTDIYTGFNGCDSTIVTDLQFFPTFEETVSITRCEGESYFAGGALQTTDGIYTDTYQAANGCDSTIITDLSFLSAVSATNEVLLCEGASYFAEGADQTDSGTYFDTLQTVDGCDSIVITELDFLQLAIEINTPDPLTCENPDCTPLSAIVETNASDVTYSWTPLGGGSIQEGQESLDAVVCGADSYQLTVIAIQGATTCEQTATIEVLSEVEESCFEYNIPNGFTPNGDGLNDVFEVIGDENFLEILSFRIYNRWGQLVHDGSGASHGWNGLHDGKPAVSDVYAFVAELRFTNSEQVILEAGDVTLIR